MAAASKQRSNSAESAKKALHLCLPRELAHLSRLHGEEMKDDPDAQRWRGEDKSRLPEMLFPYGHHEDLELAWKSPYLVLVSCLIP